MIFKPATLEDSGKIFKLVCTMVGSSMVAAPTLAKIEKVIKNNYLECAWNDGVLIGFMAGHVSETFLNNEKNAYDNGLFIAPEYRGGTTAFRLVAHFEAWAKAQGAVNVWLCQSIGHKQEKTLRFYEHLGYTCQGFNTCKKL